MVRYVQVKQGAIGTVSGALSAVGMTVALACEGNPTKGQSERTLVPILVQMMEGWRKDVPATKKKLSVGSDVIDFLAEMGMENMPLKWEG